MINEISYILPKEKGFRGNCLDEYLAAGYFRMMHMLFTTYYIQDKTGSPRIPVFWIRTLTNKISEKKEATRVRAKCAGFNVLYKKAFINEEIEELYSLYKNHVNFSLAKNCSNYLHVSYLDDPFDSLMIELRDGSRLIGVQYFDIGKKSISGILNIYHPDYLKYSLGKYLLLKTIDYGLTNDMNYYYTGYISAGGGKFDYKFFPDLNAVEVFLPVEKKWVPYISYDKNKLVEYYLSNNLLK